MKDAYPAFVVYFWVGMLAPAKTPPAIVARLNADVVKVLRSEELKTRLGDLGLETVGSTPAEFEQWLKREFERWGRVSAGGEGHARMTQRRVTVRRAASSRSDVVTASHRHCLQSLARPLQYRLQPRRQERGGLGEIHPAPFVVLGPAELRGDGQGDLAPRR